jgi:hypothetical protein
VFKHKETCQKSYCPLAKIDINTERFNKDKEEAIEERTILIQSAIEKLYQKSIKR